MSNFEWNVVAIGLGPMNYWLRHWYIVHSFTVKPTDYGSHHTMYPKIVIISDGFFNDCFPDLEGKQPCQKVRVVFSELISYMTLLGVLDEKCILQHVFKIIIDRQVADICPRGFGCHGYKNAYLLCPCRKETGFGLLYFVN